MTAVIEPSTADVDARRHPNGVDIWPMLARGAAASHDHVLFSGDDQIAGIRRA